MRSPVQRRLPCLFVISAILAAAPLAHAGKQLVPAWHSEQVLQKPESAVYDPQAQLIYVSNVCGEYCVHDGVGYISALRLDGSIQDVHWVDGLDSPQGLAIAKGKLYAADVDHIVVIDIATRSIDTKIPVEGAIFLNDVAADANGDIYVSDCESKKVHRLRDGVVETWLNDPQVDVPNGLHCTPEAIYLLDYGKGNGFKINRVTKELTQIASGIANADGIVSDGEGGFFASGAWQGEVDHIAADGTMRRVLDMSAEGITAADIEYIPSKSLLIVPDLNNSVRAFRWE